MKKTKKSVEFPALQLRNNKDNAGNEFSTLSAENEFSILLCLITNKRTGTLIRYTRVSMLLVRDSREGESTTFDRATLRVQTSITGVQFLFLI